MTNKLSASDIDTASKRLNDIVLKTPLQFSKRLSKEYNAKVYLKREDLQEVRSYKIRGAYNLMSSLTNTQKAKGVVCASAGNHAQGVAFSASHLNIKATIFMPIITPLQKINRVKAFGGSWVDVRLEGQNYDETYKAARVYCNYKNAAFVHPFK